LQLWQPYSAAPDLNRFISAVPVDPKGPQAFSVIAELDLAAQTPIVVSCRAELARGAKQRVPVR
jgi:hypothetical protein